MGPKWVHNGSKMGLRLVQIGPKQAICFSRFLSDLVHQQGPLGVLTALLQPHRGRVQTGTALLRHCRGCLTGDAWECLLRCCGHAAGAFKLAALLRHCHGRVNTSPQLPIQPPSRPTAAIYGAGPQLPSHLWGRPTVARPFVGQAHSCPASCRAL